MKPYKKECDYCERTFESFSGKQLIQWVESHQANCKKRLTEKELIVKEQPKEEPIDKEPKEKKQPKEKAEDTNKIQETKEDYETDIFPTDDLSEDII